MPEIGLTGGIGSGKSTVADRLVVLGAVLIDADQIVRELQQPGTPVFAAMQQRWGSAVVSEHGTLDRAAVAELVFHDKAELEALNAIVHPAVAAEMAARRAAALKRDPGAVVVLDIPLLVRADGEPGEPGEPTAPRYRDLAGIVVVDTCTDLAVARLVAQRNLSAEDARARVASQASREARIAIADFVINNNGTLQDLDPQINACWAWAQTLT